MKVDYQGNSLTNPVTELMQYQNWRRYKLRLQVVETDKRKNTSMTVHGTRIQSNRHFQESPPAFDTIMGRAANSFTLFYCKLLSEFQNKSNSFLSKNARLFHTNQFKCFPCQICAWLYGTTALEREEFPKEKTHNKNFRQYSFWH